MTDEKRFSAARVRTEEHKSGFESSMFNVPDGLGFWKIKEGLNEIDIVPYKVTMGNRHGKGVKGGNPHAETGWLYYERTFFAYSEIGVDPKKYICPSKTFEERDPIQDYIAKESRNPSANPDVLKALKAKERQIWLIWDHDDESKGIQLWDFSFYFFGKLLDSRIKNSRETDGWDMFYYPDKLGMTLRVTAEKHPTYGIQAVAIDFMPRKQALPPAIANHPYDLDKILRKLSYDELNDIFLQNMSNLDADPEEPGDRSSRAEGTETKRNSEPDRTTSTKSETTSEVTATSLGLKKDQEVYIKGVKYTIFRVNPDDVSLALLNSDDDVVKAKVTDLDPPSSGKSERKEDKKEEAKPHTAQDLGITKGCDVRYLGEKHSVFKISDDGLTLGLMDKNDEPVRGVMAELCSLWTERGNKKSEPSGKTEGSGKFDSEDWDFEKKDK